tara:strand:- start:848 stop:1675 length:828 start_codon:yes stop_codon:yes gene_type:complete
MLIIFLKYIFGNIFGCVNYIYLYLNLYVKYYFSYKNLYKKLNLLDFSENENISKKNKVISYNIHYGSDFFENEKIIEILKFLKNENANIYFLQEFPNIKFNNKLDLIHYFKKYLGIKNHYQKTIIKIGNIEYCSLILSRKKIEKIEILRFENWLFRLPNFCISIKINDLWYSNVHLNSDFTGLCQLYQAKELVNYIHQLNESHFILGDFNSPKKYKSIQYLNSKLEICEDENNTYPSILPMVKLDYCFNYKTNKKYNIKVKKLEYSDHYPLILEL